MARSTRLTLRHVRSAFRLIGEVHEFEPGWREHFLTSLLRLTGSQVVIGGESKVAGGQLLIPIAIDLGWATESDRRVYQRFMAAGLCYDEPAGLLAAARPDAIWTRSRRQLIPDREYYRSYGYQARQEGHNGDYLHSCQPWPEEGVICMLQLNRAIQEPPFTAVELKMIRLCQAELAHERTLRRQRQREVLVAGLPPRPRQVLELLLDGCSEKKIAATLGLSPHTIHQYVRTVYDHFEVHSRAELLARWVRS